MDSTLLLALWVAAASSVLLLLTAQNRGPCYVCTPAGSPSLTCCRQLCPSEALRMHKGPPSHLLHLHSLPNANVNLLQAALPR